MSAHKGRSKPHIEEEHENHERWLVSYADMVTLLFCLFVVMFAIGAVDQEKFEEFSNGLTAGFGAPLSVVSSADGILDQSGVMPVPVDLKPVLDPRSPASPEAPKREAEPQPGVRAEAEADEFAAALLMPARLIRRHYERIGTRPDRFQLLCTAFGASGAAMSRRLRRVI